MSTQTEPLHYFDELSGYKPEAIASYAPAQPIEPPARPVPTPMTPEQEAADRAGFDADLADVLESLARERITHPERFSDGTRIVTIAPGDENWAKHEHERMLAGSESPAFRVQALDPPDDDLDDDTHLAAEPVAITEPEPVVAEPKPARRPRAPRTQTPEQVAAMNAKAVAWSEAAVTALASGPMSGRKLTEAVHALGVSLKSSTERTALADLVTLGVIIKSERGSAFTYSLPQPASE